MLDLDDAAALELRSSDLAAGCTEFRFMVLALWFGVWHLIEDWVRREWDKACNLLIQGSSSYLHVGQPALYRALALRFWT